MPNYEELLKDAQAQLNNAFEIYKNSPGPLAREFDELKLQTSIFQYEVCFSLVSFIKAEPEDFAMKVSLKTIIHYLFEYNKSINNIVKRIKLLAKRRGILVSTSELGAQKKKWKNEFEKLKHWEIIRNKVTGHYDLNTKLQFNLLEKVDPQEVMSVFIAFLSCNLEVLKLLKSVGAKSVT